MNSILKASALVALGLVIGASALQAAEPEEVKVNLSEQNGQMAMTLTSDTLKAGTVEFVVSNASSTLMHEFLIASWTGKPGALPYDAKQQQVNEDDISGLQGVEDMPAGTKATLRLVLAPGKYIAFCDQPGHYRAGMFHVLTVTP